MNLSTEGQGEGIGLHKEKRAFYNYLPWYHMRSVIQMHSAEGHYHCLYLEDIWAHPTVGGPLDKDP